MLNPKKFDAFKAYEQQPHVKRIRNQRQDVLSKSLLEMQKGLLKTQQDATGGHNMPNQAAARRSTPQAS